jgi:hypothetical protein
MAVNCPKTLDMSPTGPIGYEPISSKLHTTETIAGTARSRVGNCRSTTAGGRQE